MDEELIFKPEETGIEATLSETGETAAAGDAAAETGAGENTACAEAVTAPEGESGAAEPGAVAGGQGNESGAEEGEAVTDTADTSPTGFDERRREDILRFAREYPEVAPGEIPGQVLDDWREGKGSLCDLYAIARNPVLESENAALKARIAELERALKAGSSSTGSRTTAGSPEPFSDIDAAWYDGT